MKFSKSNMGNTFMQNIVLDINIILDCYDRSRLKKYPSSKKVFDILAHGNKYKGFISSSSLDNIDFLKNFQLKQSRPELSGKERSVLLAHFMKELLGYFSISKTPSYIEVDYDDIEDAQVVASAKAIGAKVVTRDKGMLAKYPECAITAETFLDRRQAAASSIPFLDLKAINLQYVSQYEKAFDDVLNSGWYIRGEQVGSFEKEFADYCGTKHCVGTGNGLDALILILRAYKEMGILKEGDGVIVPANTYIATILAITENRLTPILIEPDERTYNIDPARIREFLESETMPGTGKHFPSLY